MRGQLRRIAKLAGLALDAAALADGPLAAAKALFAGLAMPLKRRIAPLSDRWVRLRLRVEGRSFDCVVRERADLIVLREVFVQEGYRRPVPPPRVILDLGANIGLTTLWFLLRYPDVVVHAVEPAPDTFAMLEENLRPYSRAHAHRLAATGTDGRVEFFRARESFKSGLVRTEQGQQTVIVEGRSLASLLDELGLERVDLLKLDIEGAEYDLLASFREFDRIGAIIGELHVDLMEPGRDEFLALLDGFDVTVEEMPLPTMPGADRYSFVAVRRRTAVA